MLRIRKIADATAMGNARAVAEVQALIRGAFSGMPEEDIAKLPQQLDNPFKQRFVTDLLVASDAREHVRGAAVLMHDPELRFSYLDVVVARRAGNRGSGVGGALYDRVRLEALERGSKGLYFECLPDDPETSPNPAIRRQNAARLRFYERFGARPIIGTAYQTPLHEGDTDMPFLVFDGLGIHDLAPARKLRQIVRAVLERKYAHLCPPEYIEAVVGSVRDETLALRPPRYTRRPSVQQPPSLRQPYPLVVNDRHDIHHVRERGYVESPIRIPAILEELRKTGLFREIAPRPFPERWIKAVHDGGLVDYVERACREAPEGKSVYPYVFPVRNPARKPKERSVLAGYWCIDTFTPLNRNAWPAARRGADCTLTAADAVLTGAPMAYALVRPPGHHAERRNFGGFCYISNAAVAANYLAQFGRVAMLDIDYHHGNGQQDIFYERGDVLTVSIHGDPSFAYPYFTGFRNETGRNAGAGFNLNIPLPETITPEAYREALARALRRVARHEPDYLVLCLGFDTGRGDPTGTWQNRAEDFRQIGRMIADADYPTLIVQEGGYRVRALGSNARHFFDGFAAGQSEAERRAETAPAKLPPAASGRGPRSREVWRESVRESDAEAVRGMVAATGMFTADEVAIAGELVEERVAKGRISGYEFVLLERGGQLAGYACFGQVPGAEGSFDLYWIAVRPEAQGNGLGQRILARAEAAMRRAGCQRYYADTSGRPDYAPTRNFYLRAGFVEAARLADFYRPGDDKVIYEKRLTS
jgi:acetoin utilization deacetylase AcuC-like enzyme/GNAT superfamily N-acetyltransferase